MNSMILMIRREFWEHRAFVVAPAIVAAILLCILIFAGNNAHFGDIPVDAVKDIEYLGRNGPIVAALLAAFGAPFFMAVTVVAIFYLLDSLHSDRKDRSVLFWKSLPISDTQMVTSKLATGALALPLVAVGTAFVGNILFALALSTRLSFEGPLNVWPILWNPRSWFDAHVVLIYGALAGVLWYLPIMGWLLMVSAWAKRAVMLWAVLPPLLLMLVELAFDKHYVASALGYRLVGWFDLAFLPPDEVANVMNFRGKEIPQRLTDLMNPGAIISSPDVWIGIVVAAAFVWATILIRRHRTEI